jgi:ribosomal RNA-processing protein 8
MGCGEGRLGLELQGYKADSGSKKATVVHSFDLVSPSPHVVAADIAHVPLEDASVDIVVFCLSLMGTNIGKSHTNFY